MQGEEIERLRQEYKERLERLALTTAVEKSIPARDVPCGQSLMKEGFSFLDKDTYEALPMTRFLNKSGRPIPGQPDLPVEEAAEIKILSKKDPVPLDLLLRSNLVHQELSRMKINSLSLLDKTVQVTPEVMRMLGELLWREVTRDGPEWAAAMTSLTISEKVRIKQQHKGIVGR